MLGPGFSRNITPSTGASTSSGLHCNNRVGWSPWPVWLSWLEYCPIYWKVAGSIPSQDTCLGFDPQSGSIQEVTNQCISLTSMFFCLSPHTTFLSLYKSNEKIFLGEDLKKKKKEGGLIESSQLSPADSLCYRRPQKEDRPQGQCL